MLKKGTKLHSILKFKCPHCQEGEFFISRNPYNLKKAGEIHRNCEVCKRSLIIEPGFYYGAMYVSYGLGVALFVATFMIIYLIYPEAATTTYLVAIFSLLVVLGPWLFAVSKTIWANMFIEYKGVHKTEKELSVEKEKLKLKERHHGGQHLTT